MPIPSLFDLTTLETSNAGLLNTALYDPRFGSVVNSFEVLNGHLAHDNLESADMLTHRKIQPNSVSYGRMAGFTGNLTYADSLFTNTTKRWEDFIDIPGCAVTIPVRMDCLIIFTWNIGGAVNTKYDWGGTWSEYSMPTDYLPSSTLGGCFSLNISRLDEGRWEDVSVNAAGSRAVPPGSHNITEEQGGMRYANKRIRRPHRDRFWSGSYIYHSTGGSRENVKWYSARVVCHNQWGSFRIRTRNMKAIVLKYGGENMSTTTTATPQRTSDPSEPGTNPTTGKLGTQEIKKLSGNNNDRRPFPGTLARDVIL